jgi:FkbM family methyltransferase
VVLGALHEKGLDVSRTRSVPFGVRWEDDLAALLGPIDTLVALDVGANEGQTALRLAQRFPEAEIHSFEPSASTFEQLTENTRDLRVRCVHSALGDAPGFATLAKPGTGQASLHAEGPGEIVQIDTVDAYCDKQGIDAPTLLKIDTEGHELAVLNGAAQRLDRAAIPFVLTECDFARRPNEPHGDFFEIADMLFARGYRLVSFYSGGVDGLGWRWGDALFMSPRLSLPVAMSPHAA